MKKQSLILAQIFLLLISGKIISQRTSVFVAFDRFGNEYNIEDLNINSNKSLGGIATIHAAPTVSCSAGYFIAYYPSGSFWDGNTAAQNVLCAVLTDLSNFISSSLSTSAGVGPKIRLYCMNTPTTIPGALGSASAFHVFPNNPVNPNQGIIDNQIYKMIISGIDSYSAIPSSFVNGNAFYHGIIQINPSPQGGNWNMNLTNSNVGSSEFCLYTLLLHEVVHALGFASLISSNGTSVFGSLNNFYSRYDKFLKDASGASLISSTTASTCANSNIVFTSSLSTVIASATSGCISDVTTCSTAVQYSSTNVNVPVYTPNCFEQGSSLSHFEDMCPIPSTVNLGCATNTNNAANNNKYYVMSNGAGTGTCYVNRFLKTEERYVLCDLGYSVNTVYGSTVAGSNYTYAGTSCSGSNIWGMNDGLVNGSYSYTAALSVTSAISVSVSTILSNDSPNTVSLSCLEVIYNNLITASVSGSNVIITNTANISGLVVLKYIPQDISGNFGNPTYIYVYFLPGNCSTSNPCDFVQNGGFESYSGTAPCGEIWPNAMSSPTVIVDCWESDGVSPDYFVRGCTAGGGVHNLGINTWSMTSPPVNSYTGSPNNAVIGLSAYMSSSTYGFEIIKNQLSSSLSPGLTYKLDLWALNPNVISSITSSLLPIVISINSMPNMAYTGLPTVLTTLTINPTPNWIAYTNTFVFTPTVSHSALSINIHTITAAFSPTAVLNYYCFLDDVSIKLLPTPTFSIPNSIACGNTTFTDLAQYASITGTFIGAGVTYTNSQYDFNLSGTLSAGSYPIGFTYSTTSGCLNTLWQTIVVSSAVTLSVAGTATGCAFPPFDTVTLTASSSCTGCTSNSYYWEPGYILGSNQTFTPIVNSVYTLNLVSGICVASTTLIPLALSPTCCTSTVIPTFTETSITATNSSIQGFNMGPMKIMSSFTIQSGVFCVMYPKEFIMDPSVKITVSAGATLQLLGSHLFTCGNSMWEGIFLVNSGCLQTWSFLGKDCLIEDAKIAIDAGYQNTSGITPVLNINNTIFNKNHIDINFGDPSTPAGSYSTALQIKNCVFTCRDLPFTSISWPNVSTATNGLRYAANATTGLAPPYIFQSAPIAYLKNPYSSQRSSVAIRITNMGVTTGTAYPLTFRQLNIAPTNAADFNLFDAHENFIQATNSNLSFNNAVFQNTQTYSVSGTPTVGAAISHFNNSVSNYELDLTASSVSLGNRFYNCHYAVNAKSSFNLKMGNATIRSTQSTAANTPTYNGVFVRTNQAGHYEIKNNEFTNVRDGVAITFTPAPTWAPDIPFYADPTQTTYVYSTYIRTVGINNNTFSPSSVANAYSKNAINVNCIYNAVTNSSHGWLSCSCNSITINNNNINGSYNGIQLDGLDTYTLTCMNMGMPKTIAQNSIELTEDYWNDVQKGIEFTRSRAIPLITQKIQTVEHNILSVTGGTAVLSNTNITLYYGKDNGAVTGITASVYPTPHILCNQLSNANKGFMFDGINKPANWRGNNMQDLKLGMSLVSGGELGEQGNTSEPTDNAWIGSWTGNSQTYVDGTSDAINSELWVRNTATTIPNSNSGIFPAQNYSLSVNIHTVTSGLHDCDNEDYHLIPSPLPKEENYSTAEHFYIAKKFAYNYLAINDSIRTAVTELGDYYNGLATSSIAEFYTIEQKISEGDFATASGRLSSLNSSGFHQVETNYYNFYTLYLKYMQADEAFTEDDVIMLTSLSGLCPGSNGSVVFQARALHQLIFGQVYNGPDGCAEGMGARSAVAPEKNHAQKVEQVWDVELFPNPAQNQLNIVNEKENELLKISIKDLSGRILLNKYLKTNGFIANLGIDLINGAYFITISNSNNETITKKLLIAK